MLTETIAQVAARQARQVASRVVTETPRTCECVWCSTSTPRPKRLLVNGLKPLSFEFSQWVVQ